MAIISEIRKRVGLLVLIIALAILSFLLMDVFSGPGGGLGANTAPTAGSVNGTEINYQAYQDRLQKAISSQQRVNPNMTDQQRLQVEEQAWDGYVKEVLAEQQYEQLGLSVPKEEVRSLFFGDNPHPSLKAEKTFQNAQGVYDPDLVRQYETTLAEPVEGVNQRQLQDSRTQWKTFKNFLVNDQKRKKYSNLVKKAVYVPNWFAETNNEFTGRKSNISYVMVPYTNVDDASVNLSDGDITSFIQANAKQYKQEANTDIEFISIPIEPSAADLQNASDQVTQRMAEFGSTNDINSFVNLYSDTPYTNQFARRENLPSSIQNEAMNAPVGQVMGPYENENQYLSYKIVEKSFVADSVNTAHILIRVNQGENPAIAKGKIDSLYNLAIGGADFEELAVNNSQDQSNAANGGSLGWVKPGQMVKEFNDAVFNSNEGDISTVQTQFGWHLVKINNSFKNIPAVKIAYLTKDILASTETGNALYAQANEFAGRYRTLEDFRAGANEKGYAVKSANGLSKNAFNIDGIGATNDISSWAFSSNAGDVSKVFILDDKYVVAAVVNKNAAGTPTAANASTALRSKVMNMKKAESIISGIGGNTDLNSIASANGQSVENAENVSFSGINSALNDEPKVRAAVASLAAGATSKPIAGEKGVYVVNVLNVVDPGTDAIASVKTSQTNLQRNKVDIGLMDAVKNASDVEDIRYQFRAR